MMRRRDLLVGASVAAAYAALPRSAEAISGSRLVTVLGGLRNPPSGYSYLVGADGAYLLGADGAYLLGRA